MSSYIVKQKNVDWTEFVIHLSARFRDEAGVNIVEKLNKVSQTASLEEYGNEFEELKSLISQQNHVLPRFLFLGFFYWWNKSNLKPFVRAIKPVTMAARLQFISNLNPVHRLQEENITASQAKPTFSSSKYTKPVLPPILPTSPSSSKLNTIQPTYSKPFQTSFQRPQINISREERGRNN